MTKELKRYLSKTEKLDRVQEKLENYFARLINEYPELKLWTCGDVSSNSFEIGSMLND